MVRVPYHLERDDGSVLSLTYANPEAEAVENKLAELRADSEAQAEFLEEWRTIEPEDELHLLYTSELFERSFPEAGDIGLPPDDTILVDTMLDVFRGVEEESIERRDEFKWYKRPDLAGLARAINQTEWKQSIPRVAGCLLSNLILKHPLPNANHRSSLGFIQLYLSSIAEDFEIPDTGEPGEWYDWSEAFVYQSKRYLMLSRKARFFRHLRVWGVDEVIRKNGTRVDLEDCRIDVADPRSHFRDEHRELAIEFVFSILERTVYTWLIGEEDPGRSVFLDRLEGGQ